MAGRAAVDRPAGEAVPQAHEEPHRLEKKTGWRYSIACRTSPAAESAASRAAATPSTSTSSTASTPSWRPAASAPPRPWACGTCRRNPGRSTAAGSSPRTSPPTWPPGPASSAARRRGPAGRRPGHAPLPDLAHPRPARPPRPPARPQDQPRLAVEGDIPHLLAAAMRPARTRLTSTDHPGGTKGDTPGAVGAGAHPGTPGSTADRHRQPNRHRTRNRAPAQSVTPPREP